VYRIGLTDCKLYLLVADGQLSYSDCTINLITINK